MAESKGPFEQKIVQDALFTPFSGGEVSDQYGYTRLTNGIGLTHHYTTAGAEKSKLPIPKTPIFHPYFPFGGEEEEAQPTAKYDRAHGGIPATTVSVRLPKQAAAIFTTIKAHLAQFGGIDPDKTDVFFVTQNMPWNNNVDWLLFRPHYWVHSLPEYDAPIKAATLESAPNCFIGLYANRVQPIRLNGTINQILPNAINVNSHFQKVNIMDKDSPNHIVCSPGGAENRNAGGCLSNVFFNNTQSLFSVVKTPDGRTAITLHWLLNPEDQALITKLSHKVRNRNMLALMAEIEKLGAATKLNEGPMFDLKFLYGAAGLDLQSMYAADLKKAGISAPPPAAGLPTLGGMPPSVEEKLLKDTLAASAREEKGRAEARAAEEKRQLEAAMAASAALAAGLQGKPVERKRDVPERKHGEETSAAVGVPTAGAAPAAATDASDADHPFRAFRFDAPGKASAPAEDKERKDAAEQRPIDVKSLIDVVQHLSRRTTDITENLKRISQDLKVLMERKERCDRADARSDEAKGLSERLDAKLVQLVALGTTLSASDLQRILQETSDLIAISNIAITEFDSYIAGEKKYIASQQESLARALLASEEQEKETRGPKAGGPKSGGTKPPA